MLLATPGVCTATHSVGTDVGAVLTATTDLPEVTGGSLPVTAAAGLHAGLVLEGDALIVSGGCTNAGDAPGLAPIRGPQTGRPTNPVVRLVLYRRRRRLRA
jgi:hypothetical protein